MYWSVIGGRVRDLFSIMLATTFIILNLFYFLQISSPYRFVHVMWHCTLNALWCCCCLSWWLVVMVWQPFQPILFSHNKNSIHLEAWKINTMWIVMNNTRSIFGLNILLQRFTWKEFLLQLMTSLTNWTPIYLKPRLVQNNTNSRDIAVQEGNISPD